MPGDPCLEVLGRYLPAATPGDLELEAVREVALLADRLLVSVNLVDDFIERRRLIFNDRIRTQDPARKRRRAADEQGAKEFMVA